MTRIDPIYLAALAAAVSVALALRLVPVAHPWPAALALNVYGLVAWPGVRRERLPVTSHAYAAGWAAAALVLVLLEKFSALVH